MHSPRVLQPGHWFSMKPTGTEDPGAMINAMCTGLKQLGAQQFVHQDPQPVGVWMVSRCVPAASKASIYWSHGQQQFQIFQSCTILPWDNPPGPVIVNSWGHGMKQHKGMEHLKGLCIVK